MGRLCDATTRVPWLVFSVVFGFISLGFNNCSEPYRAKSLGNSSPSSMQVLGLKTVHDLTFYTRLTKGEYRYVVRDLLDGMGSGPIGDLDGVIGGFAENLYEGSYKNHTLVNTYPNIEKDQFELARKLAGYFVSSNLFKRLCSSPGSCADSFVQDLLPRLWKKTLNAQEQEELKTFYNSYASADRDFYFLFRVFASPYFHYKIFNAKEKDPLQRSFKIGNLLSYYITGSYPDDELQADIDSGKIVEEQVIRNHVERLLQAHPVRFAEMFVLQWLNVSTLMSTSTKYKNVAVPDVMLEPALIFAQLMGDGDYISSFLELKYNVVNPGLAGLYGISGITSGWTRGQGTKTLFGTAYMSYLTSDHENDNPNPIRRGSYVVNHLLCKDIQFPTSAIQEKVDEVVNNAPMDLSPPARMAYFRGFPVCASCHNQFDHHGLALEEIGVLGATRTKYYTGHDVVATGRVDDIQYNNSLEFVGKLARSEAFSTCFASQVYNYITSSPYTQGFNAIEKSDVKQVIAGRSIGQVVAEMVVRGLGGI
ncbi:MAG: DUF1592 domain-containing protein [Bdellovibrionales bacterium]|nr:DUF1592 domain-containing protein [Bdellovibrionales bacterium]